MGYNNETQVIGVNLINHVRRQSSEHFFANTILIDKSSEILHPLLYQFHSSDEALNSDFYSFRSTETMETQNHSFIMRGEVLGLDKQKKIVYLRNNVTITYKYLVIASGLHHSILASSHNHELSAGIHALAEALRIRNNISSALYLQTPHSTKNEKDSTKKQSSSEHPKINAIKGVLSSISKIDQQKSLEMTMAGTEKRLYEVQL